MDYLGVTVSFSKNALGFACDIDIIILGWPIVFQITFYLDFDRFLESLLEGVVSLFQAIFMGRDNSKPRAGQRDDARYKSKTAHVADDKVDDYDYEDSTAGLGSPAPAAVTPEQKLAARLWLDTPPATEGVYARAAAFHSAMDAGAGHPHGAVYHAALGAHRTLGHGGRELLRDDDFGLDAADGLVWTEDERGEESLVFERELGAAVRSEHEQHTAAVALSASLASRASPFRSRAAALAHAVKQQQRSQAASSSTSASASLGATATAAAASAAAYSAAADIATTDRSWNELLSHELPRGKDHAAHSVDGQVARAALGMARGDKQLKGLARDLHLVNVASTALLNTHTHPVTTACGPAAMHWSSLDALLHAVCAQATKVGSSRGQVVQVEPGAPRALAFMKRLRLKL